MKKIYAVKANGELISGMEVFRQVYKVVFGLCLDNLVPSAL